MFWLEKYPESIQTKKKSSSFLQKLKKKCFVEEVFWDSVPFLSWQHFLQHIQRRKWVSTPLLTGCCWQGLSFLRETRCRCLSLGFLSTSLALLVWPSTERYFVRSHFWDSPKYQMHRFFFLFLESTMEPLFLSWLEMKGKASKCSDPQMSLVWMG